MIKCTILPNGDLLTTADNEARANIAAMLRHSSYWTIMADLFEAYSCNGSFTLFDAGDGNPFVGLTSAPCIAESMDYMDNGDHKIVGQFWYASDYMLTCNLEALRDRGRYVWSLAT